MVELDSAGARGSLGHGGRSDLDRRVEQFKHPLARCHSRLQDVVFLTQVLDGTEKALRVLHEGDQHAECSHTSDHVQPAEPDNAGYCNRRQDFDYRVIERVSEDSVFERFHVAPIHIGELLEGALLSVEQLQNHHAGDMFLQVGIDTRNGYANSAVGVAHLVAENLRGPEDERQHGEGDQRQLPIHAQHDHQDPDQDKNILENRDHAGGKHFVEGINIRCDAGDQAAHRVLVEEADVHVLQVTENLAAQVEHHLLASPLHEIGLQELQKEGGDEQAYIDPCDLCNAH